MKEWRILTVGMASGSWWAWFFAGQPLRGATTVVLYLLLLGLVELVDYLRRHVRWS